eukprot:TRINITY_DN19522_c0_g1_i1.p1 TRINITY_DN19522_c0_g1~~TRINITY_DN19522_c0_g1_i1.p1  ORF type:complete len:639 (+),score=43.39 TRINITY_DN19522_c0_g1_i1:226-2142(+)
MEGEPANNLINGIKASKSLSSSLPVIQQSSTAKASRTSIPSSEGAGLGSVQALPSDIDRGLLRAAPMTEVLSGVGKHWKSIATTAADYELSEDVSEMDYFLSHDWGTSRFEKLLTLCLFFNRRAACLVSCALAVPIALVGSSPLVTASIRSDAAKIVCPFVYILTLLFGQRLLGLLWRPPYAFLDKLCIHQTDEKKKKAGILGLAGFLRASRRLLVLWSPNYFSRLWCTYELVTWGYLHGFESGTVKFLPGSASQLECLGAISWIAAGTMRSVLDRMQFSTGSLPPRIFNNVITTFMVVPLSFTVVKAVREIAAVQGQIESFGIRSSKCFCCTCDHRHPLTGKRLLCDRELVYKTLQKWQRQRLSQNLAIPERGSQQSPTHDALGLCDCGSTVDESLDHFDQVVRHGLSGMFSSSTNRALLCMSYNAAVSSCVPVVWSALDRICHYWHERHYIMAIRTIAEYSYVILFVYPLLLVALFRSIVFTDRVTKVQEGSRGRDILCTCVGSCAFISSAALLWVPSQLVLSHQDELVADDLLLALLWIGLASLTRCAMRTPRRSTTTSDSHSSHAPAKCEHTGFPETKTLHDEMLPRSGSHSLSISQRLSGAEERHAAGAVDKAKHLELRTICKAPSEDSVASL